MKIFNLFLIFMIWNFTFGSESFSTEIGQCNFDLYEGQQIKNQNLQNLIINDLQKLVAEYGIVENSVFEVYIADKLVNFNRLAKGPVPEWGAAVARSNPDRIVIKGPGISNMSYSRLREVLRHELNHIYFFRKRGTVSVPRWFSEGLASDWAGELNLQKKILLSSALWENRSFSLEALRHFGQFHRDHARLAYAQSAAAIEAMRYFYQDDIIINVLNELKYESDFDTLFSRLTGDNGVEFLIKYESFLNENYRWLFLLKTSNLLFILMPLLLISGFMLKRRRSRKILDKWEKEEAILDNEHETD